jgi:hypothetical protein
VICWRGTANPALLNQLVIEAWPLSRQTQAKNPRRLIATCHLCESVAFAVAWPVAELSAVPPGGERHQVGSDRCGRCHFGGPNRVGDLASGQPAALVKQFDRKLVKLRSASARGRRGHLASVKAMTEKGGG